jgi:hypothetical protein
VVKLDAIAMYTEEMGKLHRHSMLAASKAGDLKSAGDDTWHALVEEVETLRKTIARSFESFQSQL